MQVSMFWRAFQYFVKLVFSTTLICSCVGHLKCLIIDVQRCFYHCRCAAVDKLGCEKIEIKRGLQSFLTHAKEGVGDKSTQELTGCPIVGFFFLNLFELVWVKLCLIMCTQGSQRCVVD